VEFMLCLATSWALPYVLERALRSHRRPRSGRNEPRQRNDKDSDAVASGQRAKAHVGAPRYSVEWGLKSSVRLFLEEFRRRSFGPCRREFYHFAGRLECCPAASRPPASEIGQSTSPPSVMSQPSEKNRSPACRARLNGFIRLGGRGDLDCQASRRRATPRCRTQTGRVRVSLAETFGSSRTKPLASNPARASGDSFSDAAGEISRPASLHMTATTGANSAKATCA